MKKIINKYQTLENEKLKNITRFLVLTIVLIAISYLVFRPGVAYAADTVLREINNSVNLNGSENNPFNFLIDPSVVIIQKLDGYIL